MPNPMFHATIQLSQFSFQGCCCTTIACLTIAHASSVLFCEIRYSASEKQDQYFVCVCVFSFKCVYIYMIYVYEIHVSIYLCMHICLSPVEPSLVKSEMQFTLKPRELFPCVKPAMPQPLHILYIYTYLYIYPLHVYYISFIRIQWIIPLQHLFAKPKPGLYQMSNPCNASENTDSPRLTTPCDEPVACQATASTALKKHHSLS